jgi:hypothetical protein
LGPRRSGGTLQLSTRCSSLALLLSRSLPVRLGCVRAFSVAGSNAPPAAASPMCAARSAAAPPKTKRFSTVLPRFSI